MAARASHASRKRTARLGRLLGEPERSQHIADGDDEPALDRGDGRSAQGHERLADFGDVEESSSAEHGGRDAVVGECPDELRRLRMRPVEDGDAARIDAAIQLVADPGGDTARLGFIVLVPGDGRAVVPCGGVDPEACARRSGREHRAGRA